jgi:hypothetical protein
MGILRYLRRMHIEMVSRGGTGFAVGLQIVRSAGTNVAGPFALRG